MRAGIALLLAASGLAAQTTEPLTGSIRGTVQDSAGQPFYGILVEAVTGAAPKPVTKTTDQSGKYAIAELPPGTYFVRYDPSADSSGFRQVNLDAGQDVVLDFVVPAISSISGRVLDQNEDPVAGASVYLVTSEYAAGLLRPVVAGPRRTHPDGTYSFDVGVQANRKYYILVDRDTPKNLKDQEPIELPTYYPSAIRIDSASPLVLRPGEQRAMVDVKIARSPVYCVEGQVKGIGRFEVQAAPLAGTPSCARRVSPKTERTGRADFHPPTTVSPLRTASPSLRSPAPICSTSTWSLAWRCRESRSNWMSLQPRHPQTVTF